MVTLLKASFIIDSVVMADVQRLSRIDDTDGVASYFRGDTIY